MPEQVLVRIMALLSDPADVFAVARTCKPARAAACARGAFPHVRASALDDALAERRRAAALRGGGGALSSRAGASAPRFLAFLASHDAALGVRSLALAPRAPRGAAAADAGAAALAGACALVARCAALEALHLPREWGAADANRVVAAASSTPVSHVSASHVLPALLSLPKLTSLALDTSAAAAAATSADAFDAGGLEVLVETGRLATLSLRVTPAAAAAASRVVKPRPLRLRSATLTALTLCGGALALAELACPRLVALSLEAPKPHAIVAHGDAAAAAAAPPPLVDDAADADSAASAALAVILGCPLVDWRAPPPEASQQQQQGARRASESSRGGGSAADADADAERALGAAWQRALEARFPAGGARAQALAGDVAALRFAAALRRSSRCAIVAGRLARLPTA
jgi:hypothetical protein